MKGTIFHHHIFKNAGTSIDDLAERHPKLQQTYLEPGDGEKLSDYKLQFIHPKANKVLWLSSHHPSLQTVQPWIQPHLRLIVIRHPLSRVLSVYEFERRQGLSGVGSKSAQMASSLSMPEWVDWHLELGEGSVICNYQAHFLSQGPRASSCLNESDLLEAVLRNLRSDFNVGIFEDLSGTIKKWKQEISNLFNLTMKDEELRRLNASSSKPLAIRDSMEILDQRLGSSRLKRLEEQNQLDLAIHEQTKHIFENQSVEAMGKSGE